MASGGQQNLTRYNIKSTASVARMNAVPLNESVPLLKEILDKMRMNKRAREQYSGTQ
jgi:hypothetical protein